MRHLKNLKKHTSKKIVAQVLALAMCVTSLQPVLVSYAAEETGTQKYLVDGWQFDDNTTQGWSKSWGDNSIMNDANVTNDNQRLKMTVDFSNTNDNSWSGVAVKYTDENKWSVSDYTSFSFDLYYTKSDIDSDFSIKVAASDGSKEKDDDGNDTNREANLFDGNLVKVSDCSKGQVGELEKAEFNFEIGTGKLLKETLINKLEIVITQKTIKYKGDIYIDNIKFDKQDSTAPDTPETPSVIKVTGWNFDDGEQNWQYDDSWKGTVNISGSHEHDSANGRLKVNLDYSKETENKGWMQAGISLSNEGGFDFSAGNLFSFDFYYNPSLIGEGNICIKPTASSKQDEKEYDIFNGDSPSINELTSSDDDKLSGFKKVTYKFSLNEDSITKIQPEKIMLVIVGRNTDYNGAVYFDNIKVENIDRGYKNSTITPQTATSISTTSTELKVNDESKQYTNSIKLVDDKANDETKALYQYLKAVGESSSVIYGHMEDTVLKAGNDGFTYSDTEDVTNSISAIDGLDCGGLFDGFAKKYVDRYGKDNPEGVTVNDNTFEDDVKAAAAFSNKSIAKGAIMTLSSHLPNFAHAKLKSNADSFTKAYDKYDYTGGDSYNLTGDCMNNILPGGKFNDAYISYLDLIADYAKQVNEPVLFRPLHENTGSWFWWGKAFCDAETYKSVFKYTVDYLRDEKGVHNFLYLYGPGSEASSETEYEERYPGDNYVDMVGFDSYDAKPSNDASYAFMKNFENTVKLTNDFANKHNKLFAVTETGISNDSLGLLPKDNPRQEWYMEILNIVTKSDYNCCYFMLWSNYSSTSSYYTPFVVKKDGETLYGHEMLDSFIKFYNDKRSIFATDQKDIISKFSTITAPSVAEKEIDGYITSPVANSRILEATTIVARLNMATDKTVSLRASGNGKTIELTTAKDSTGKIYTAELTKESLDSLGKTADGKIGLYIDNKLYQEISVILNIEEKAMLPEQVDDFESYGGLTNLLLGKWATNKDSGCTVEFSLVNDLCYEGEYALKFAYNETKTGWAGATISKEADWSAYNALQFWVKPDGKNQKTVIQINVNKESYEAYLNLYPEYTNASTPLLVTLPFSEFKKNNGDVLTSEALKNMSGFGLWVNAIGDSPAFANGETTVSGELYYDDIRAVTAETNKPVFKVAEGKKPEEDNNPSKDKYTVTFDTSAVQNATVSVQKNDRELFNSGDSVSATDKLQFVITPADGYSIISAEAKVSGNTCAVSKAEKIANGVYIITLSGFTADTKVDSLSVTTEKSEVRENGTDTKTNVGGANLSKTEFKDIQEDIKNDVIDALKVMLNNGSTEDKKNAQTAIDAIEKGEAFIDISLQVKKSDGITDENEKKENDIKIEDIRNEVQKNNSDANVEVKTAAILDISLFSICKNRATNEEITRTDLRELTKPVKISMKLPDGIPTVKNGTERTYYIICIHKNKNGQIESTKVQCDYDKDEDIISFDGSKFSTYVLCYADVTPKSANNPSTGGSTISGGGTSVVLGSVTSTPTPVPTSTPSASTNTAPSTTVTPMPSEKPSATGIPSVTDKPSQTEQPSNEPSTSSSEVKKGTKFITKGITYKVTSVSGKKTVKCVSAKKNIKKAVVPATVKINGKKYKVTVIAKNAFKNNKKLTKVTIGKNVQNIGKNAFKGCKNLKKIVVKTKKLTATKVGSDAFNGINNKAVVKVPKSKVKVYKKIIKAKGAGKKVKIKK